MLVRIIPFRFGNDGAMAIGAIELDERAAGTATNLLHVEMMIELDGAGVVGDFASDGAQDGELWMAILATADVGGVLRGASKSAEITVALRAVLVGGGRNIDAAAMFHVASGAVELFGGNLFESGLVMAGAIMAGKTCGVEGFSGIRVCLGQVTGGAFFFEDGVSGTETSAAIDAAVFGDEVYSDPDQSN